MSVQCPGDSKENERRPFSIVESYGKHQKPRRQISLTSCIYLFRLHIVSLYQIWDLEETNFYLPEVGLGHPK